jgi:hypothetical protein
MAGRGYHSCHGARRRDAAAPPFSVADDKLNLIVAMGINLERVIMTAHTSFAKGTQHTLSVVSPTSW